MADLSGIIDRAQRDHLTRKPWVLPDSCTCRIDERGERYFTCRRKACGGRGQACGGYCARCFDRRITRPQRPEVVVLCGSTRFSDAFQRANYDLTLAGKIVLSVGCDTKSDEGLGITDEQKAALDALHKRKIDMADRVLVLNVGGYIGASTRSEITYAEWFEVPIDYLEPTGG
ncbi:MAG: hypothetical protein ACRDYZ_07925 [Acidimicrobiales bacterium]